MITKDEYEELIKQHEIGCKNNDYSKMIMMGDSNDIKIKKYESEFVCKHPSEYIELINGRIERCRKCHKEWG